MTWLPAIAIVSFSFFIVSSTKWVEIPQFSNQQKIYQAPVFYGFVRKETTDLCNISELSGQRDLILVNQPVFSGHIRPCTTQHVINSLHKESDENIKTESDENVEVESSEEESITQFNEPLTINDASDDMNSTTDTVEPVIISLSTNLSNTSQYLNEQMDKKAFLHYLPINLFKRVHKTLKSQPPTLKGKIRFLKVFEHTLLSEIEAHLNAALVPSRMRRETRDHQYNINDHDEKIGFPSLEGTLMAISFLTFAVYLVRLIMMLFKNAGTIGIAPIVIGRKKRSIDNANEERIKILSYLD